MSGLKSLFFLAAGLITAVSAEAQIEACGEFASIPGTVRSIHSNVLKKEHGDLMAITADSHLSVIHLTRDNDAPAFTNRFSIDVGYDETHSSFMDDKLFLSRQRRTVTDGINLIAPSTLSQVHLYNMTTGAALQSVSVPFINTAPVRANYPFYSLEFPYADWCTMVGEAGAVTSIGRVAVAGGSRMLVFNGPNYTNRFCYPPSIKNDGVTPATSADRNWLGMNPGVTLVDLNSSPFESGFFSLPLPADQDLLEDSEEMDLIRGFAFRGVKGAAFDPISEKYAAAYDLRFAGNRDFGAIFFFNDSGIPQSIGWSPIEKGGIGNKGSLAPLGRFLEGNSIFAAGAPSPGKVDSGFLEAVNGTPFGFIREKAGTVFIYDYNGETLRYISGDTDNQEFGYSLAALGDLTGDGNPEFAVGAPGTNQVFIVSLTADKTEVILSFSGADRFGESVGAASTSLNGVADILAVGTETGARLISLKKCSNGTGVTEKTKLAADINNANRLVSAIRMMSLGDSIDEALEMYPDLAYAFDREKGGMEGAWEAFPELDGVISKIIGAINKNPEFMLRAYSHSDTLTKLFSRYSDLGEAFSTASAKFNSVKKQLRTLKKQLKKARGARRRAIEKQIAKLGSQKTQLSRSIKGYWKRRLFGRKFVNGFVQNFSNMSLEIIAELRRMSNDM